MGRPEEIRVFAPASVSNVGCGFDILGFAIDGPGDEIVASRRETPGVAITEITGEDGRLPREAERNTAAVAAMDLLRQAGREDAGVSLAIHKRMPLASGIGSSAASAVGGVVAVDRLLQLQSSPRQLLLSALEGERIASGGIHPDNVAPSLMGGWVLARTASPPDLVPLPVPEGLTCALVRPHLELKTDAARALLGDQVPLQAAIAQWGNVGALVAALYRGDLELLGRSLEDAVAEPKRAALVPGFSRAKAAAKELGALGAGLSGAGPSIFALCRDRATAERVAVGMAAALEEHGGLGADQLVSMVGAEGARVLAEGEGRES